MEPFSLSVRLRSESVKSAFNFAYCLRFSTLHRSQYVTYTELRIVIALTVCTGLHVQTSVFLAARQEDSRSRNYEQAIAIY